MIYTYFFTSGRKEYKIVMNNEYMIPRAKGGEKYDVLHTPWRYYVSNAAGFTKMQFTAGYMKISTWEHPLNPVYYAVYSVEGFPSTVQQ